MTLLSSEADRLDPRLRNAPFLDANLHSPERRLIELRMEHADLNAVIDHAGQQAQVDELLLRRLKKRRLALRDELSRLERALDPDPGESA